MRVMLSALAIVALIAITGAAQVENHPVWLGPELTMEMKTEKYTQPGLNITFIHNGVIFFPGLQNAIPATAINVDAAISFSRAKDVDDFLLLPMRIEPRAYEDFRCGLDVGLVIGAETFCGTSRIGLKQNSDGSVLLLVRFGNIGGWAKTEARLEINISELSGEVETSPEYMKNRKKFCSFFDLNSLGNLKGKKSFPFILQWLSGLLKYGVVESTAPNPLEGEEDKAKTFLTRPVRLSAEAMTNLRNVLL